MQNLSLNSKDFQKDLETLFGVGPGFKLISPHNNKSIWKNLEEFLYFNTEMAINQSW